MKPVRCITKAGLLILHEQSLLEHGGLSGLRDEALLESALARSQNLLAYQEDCSVSAIAAAYALGLALGLFLAKNGWLLNVSEAEATVTMLKLAAGALSESELSDWIAGDIEPQ